MHPYALAHLSDTVLLGNLTALVTQERHTTASLIAHIAEVDDRKLYAPAGYSSMHAYCVGELRLAEDASYKRIQAARAARRFPAIFGAIAEGRLHLSGACLLAPYLTEANAEELLAEAAGRRKSEIEVILTKRFSASEVVRPLAAALSEVLLLAPGQVEHARSVATTPLSPERYLLQIPVDASTRDKLRYAQALLSHAIPTGDVAQVFDRALDTLIETLEKRKLGVGAKRRVKADRNASHRPAVTSRHIPLDVRHAVWERDGAQCTFVSASGKRCEARRFLEFDHVDPVAHGGVATVDRMRLRCRTHNQLEAERVFGSQFMTRKREEARLARERAAEMKRSDQQQQDLLAGLRSLGVQAYEAHRAAEHTKSLQNAPLEERFRVALQFLRKRKIHGTVARVEAIPAHEPIVGPMDGSRTAVNHLISEKNE